MNKARRRFLIGTASLLLAPGRTRAGAPAFPVIRIGLTPVILDDRSLFLQHWRRWLEHRLGAPVEFVQRQRYRDITDLLLDGSLTAAWICGYPYVRHRNRMRLLAAPVYRGEPLYRSLIVSGRQDGDMASFEQLAGKVFAYSDPDSNSGYLYPVYRLREQLLGNPQLFRRAFFTWGHRNTVEAVARGLADGGAVDGYVWETLVDQHPWYAERVHVIEQSPKFGFPPLVTRRDLPEVMHRQLAETLFAMQHDLQGSELLRTLQLDRFQPGDDEDYAGIARMMEAINALERNPVA